MGFGKLEITGFTYLRFSILFISSSSTFDGDGDVRQAVYNMIHDSSITV
jgi:hypothetical protein